MTTASAVVVTSDLRGARAEDGVPHHPQPGRLQFEPDHEQQQHDAELREVQDALDVFEKAQAPGANHDARGKVAEHGAQLEAPEQRHGDDRGREEDGDLCGEAHALPGWTSRDGTMDQAEGRGNLRRA